MKEMTFLRDLLTKNKPVDIMYRCNSPLEDMEPDMLYGYCRWDGQKLESGDGDSYYLNDVIEKYEYDTDGMLIVWISVVWSSSKGE